MPVANIIDYRTNPYDVWCDVILEASCHDNSITGATEFDTDNAGYVKQHRRISVNRATQTARTLTGCITIFLYDVGALETLNEL